MWESDNIFKEIRSHSKIGTVAFPFLYRDDLVLEAMGESPELCINADRYLRHLHCTIPEGQGLFSSMPLEYIPVRVERR